MKAFEGGRQKGGKITDSHNVSLLPLLNRRPTELTCDKSCITEEEELPETSSRRIRSMKLTKCHSNPNLH